jgi:hypothetical protein
MYKRLKLNWKVFFDITDKSPFDSSNSRLFNITSSRSFIHKIGGMKELHFSPKRISPTKEFYDSLYRIKLSNNLSGNKFPFDFQGNNLVGKVNISANLYAERVICLTVDVIVDASQLSEKNISDLKVLSNFPEVYELVKSYAGLIFYGKKKKIKKYHDVKIKPCIQIAVDRSDLNSFPSNELVSSFVGHKNVKKEIEEKVLAKNNTHQIDDHNKFLIDKQGLLSLISIDDVDETEHKRKFEILSYMYEFSAAISRLMNSKYFIELSQIERESISSLINQPAGIFIHSVSSRYSWPLLVKEFQLKVQLDDVISSDDYLTHIKKPWWHISLEFKKSIVLSVIPIILTALLTYYLAKPNTTGLKVKLNTPQYGAIIRSKEIILEWDFIKDASKYLVSIKYHNGNTHSFVKGYKEKAVLNSEITLHLNNIGTYEWKITVRYYE